MIRIITLLIIALAAAFPGVAQRRVSPINTPATATQPINENKDDTARINARIRATMMHYHDENGNVIYVDTITGKEWRDSSAMQKKAPMKFPLLHSASIGVNIWDPVMRLFGQKYGLISFSGTLNIHNRYLPTFEVGLGKANNTPDDNNFTYRSPMSVYFKIGGGYNFMYNNNPDYQMFASLRYGFAPFSFSIDNVIIDSPTWGTPASATIPAQHATAGWLEVGLGLKVKLFGPISAGWRVFFHTLLHESKCEYGKPWYIPGFGSRKGAISGSFSIFYTIPFPHREKRMTTAEALDEVQESMP